MSEELCLSFPRQSIAAKHCTFLVVLTLNSWEISLMRGLNADSGLLNFLSNPPV